MGSHNKDMEHTKLGRTSRRTWLVAIGMAVGAASVLRAVHLYLQPTAPAHGHSVDLGPLDAIVQDGQRKVVSIVGMNVLIARTGLSAVALDLTCTHAGCPLHVREDAKRILCSCHGGAFDLDGQPVKAPPTKPVRVLQTQVIHGSLFLRIPARGSA